MAGTIVDIYPGAPNSAGGAVTPGSAGGYTDLTSTVYALLHDTDLNTIKMRGGYRYQWLPNGLDGQSKWGLDKPVWWQVDASFGSDEVIIDSASRFAPDSTAGVWDAAAGMWYIDVYNGGTASAATILYVGAEAGNRLSSMQWGEGYRPAQFDSGGGETIEHAKARCGAGGMTFAGILAGQSIWCSTVIGGTICRVWIWTPLGQAVKPAAQWGGLVIEAPQTAGSTLGSTPRYSPFVVGINSGSGARNPGGTIVDDGFISCYTTVNHIGHHRDVDGYGAITNYLAKNVRCYGGAYGFRVGHDGSKSSARLTGFRAEGLYFDDLNLPDKNPMAGFPSPGTGTSQGEPISAGAFADDFYCRDADIVVGTTHGFVNIGLDTATLSQRAQRPYIIGVRGRVRTGSGGELSRDARAFSANQCVDGEFYNIDIKGANTRGHVGGERTKMANCSFSLDTEAINDTNTGKSVLDIRSDLDVGPMSVELRRVHITRRGAGVRGVTLPWSCIEIRGSAAIAAGAIKLIDCVLECDAGTVPIWMWDTTGTNVNRDQTIVNVKTNSATDTKESNAQTVQGSAKTFAQMFNGAGAVVRGNVQHLTGEILSRPDRPMNRLGELALPY